MLQDAPQQFTQFSAFRIQDVFQNQLRGAAKHKIRRGASCIIRYRANTAASSASSASTGPLISVTFFCYDSSERPSEIVASNSNSQILVSKSTYRVIALDSSVNGNLLTSFFQALIIRSTERLSAFQCGSHDIPLASLSVSDRRTVTSSKRKL